MTAELLWDMAMSPLATWRHYPVGARYFSFFESSQTGTEAHPVGTTRFLYPGWRVLGVNVTTHLRPERRWRWSGAIPLLTVYAFTAWTRVILPLPFFSVEPAASMFRVEEIGAGWRDDRYRVWYPVIISRAIEPVRKPGFHILLLCMYSYCYIYVFLLLRMFCSVYSVFIVPTGIFRLPWLRFFRAFFLSCKANARAKLAKTGHGQHSS